MFNGQVRAVLFWVQPRTSGCFFFFTAFTRLTLEKVPVTVRKDLLTTGKALLTVGKTTTLDPLLRAYKTVRRKLGCVWNGAVLACLWAGCLAAGGWCLLPVGSAVITGWYTHGDTF